MVIVNANFMWFCYCCPVSLIHSDRIVLLFEIVFVGFVSAVFIGFGLGYLGLLCFVKL